MGEEGKSVRTANMRRPFWSMVFVTVKWVIASISALVILSVVFGAAWLTCFFSLLARVREPIIRLRALNMNRDP